MRVFVILFLQIHNFGSISHAISGVPGATYQVIQTQAYKLNN